MEALPTLLLRTAVNPWAYGNVGRARAVVDRLLCLPKVYLNRSHTVPHEQVSRTPSWWCGKPLRLQAQMEDTGAVVQAIHLPGRFAWSALILAGEQHEHAHACGEVREP